MKDILFEQMYLVGGARPATCDAGDNGGSNYQHMESNETRVNGVRTTVYTGWNDPDPGDLPYPDTYWYPR
jgi:hypothetical protein